MRNGKDPAWRSPLIIRLHSVMLLLGMGMLLLTAGPAMAEQETRESIETTRASLEKWVETRKLISQERKDLAMGREVMNERLELVRREIEGLREKIAEANKSITDADKRRAELVEQNDQLKATSVELLGHVVKLEARTLAILPKLPEPIRERVKPLSQRIPVADAKDVKMSTGERFANVVGILNEVNKFNREITLTSEVRQMADGSTSEVAAVYLGVGQGYYVSANGSLAGYGRPSESGWTWTADNSIAPQVSQLMAIMKNEQVAAFVKLPIEIPQSGK